MRISTRSRYAARFMLDLAIYYGKGPVYLREIAEREEISNKYLSQIVIPLKAKGLITTFRGAHGGYILSRPPSEITLKEIVETMEGDLKFIDCVKNESVCNRVSRCVTRDIWDELGTTVGRFFESFSLESMVRMYEQKKDRGITYMI